MPRLPQLEHAMERLNEEQRHVAEWHPRNGNLRITAPAGSGKTTTIVVLAARLLSDGILDPSDLLLTTFTRKAADEMKRRVKQLVPFQVFRAMRINTFHSIGLSALRSCGVDLELPEYPIWYPRNWDARQGLDMNGRTRSPDVPSAATLWGRAVEWGKMPGTGERSLQIAGASGREYAHAHTLVRAYGVDCPHELSRFWHRNGLPHDIDGNLPSLPPAFADAWSMVLESKEALAAWDFDDVLACYAHLLQRGYPRDQARVCIIDEAQDNNWRQLQLGQLIIGTESAAERGRLVLCGDSAQAIHTWRGAYPELFLQADKELEARTRPLTRNYRSFDEIIERGNVIAQGMEWQVGEPAIGARGTGGCIEVLLDKHPAQGAVDRIADELRAGESPGDYAVICRTNAAVGEYQALFTDKQIPVNVLGGRSIFETREAKVLLCYCILHGHDAVNSLSEVINTPTRYLGRRHIEQIKAVRDRYRDQGEELSLPDVIRRAGEKMGGRDMTNLMRLAREIRALRAMPWEDCPDHVRDMLIRARDKERAKHNREEGTGPDEDKPAIYKTAASIAKRFESPGALFEFTERIARNARKVDAEDEPPNDRVTLATAHKVKGLEFRRVFLHAQDGHFPHSKGMHDADGEERRLLYVAVTRARDDLTVVANPEPGSASYVRRFFADELKEALDRNLLE